VPSSDGEDLSSAYLGPVTADERVERLVPAMAARLAVSGVAGLRRAPGGYLAGDGHVSRPCPGYDPSSWWPTTFHILLHSHAMNVLDTVTKFLKPLGFHLRRDEMMAGADSESLHIGAWLLIAPKR